MRPTLHFTARSGWINDPHGITYRDGRYHVFFQYVPDRTSWAPNCHWGHATGPDLLSLTEHSVAMEDTATPDVFSEESLRASAVPKRYQSPPPK